MLGSEDGAAFWGLDEALWWMKANAAQTHGQFSLVEEIAPRGEGTPLHAHAADDEAFYVLEGELTFTLGEEAPRQVTASGFLHIPGGAVHAFRMCSETARYLIVTTPQHERFYRAISQPAVSRDLPPREPMDMEMVLAACEAHGVEVLGPPPGADGQH